MGKFKNTFVKKIKIEQKRQQEQEKLRSKHHLQQEGVLIVERTNMVKFLIRVTGRIIRILSAGILFTLSVIGLLALLYPTVRRELFMVLSRIIGEICHMI